MRVAVRRSRVPDRNAAMSARVLVPLLEPLEPHALEAAALELDGDEALARDVIRAYLCACAFTVPADHPEACKDAA